MPLLPCNILQSLFAINSWTYSKKKSNVAISSPSGGKMGDTYQQISLDLKKKKGGNRRNMNDMRRQGFIDFENKIHTAS